MYNLKLTDAFSPSGFEDEVRDIVLSEITPFCDSIKVDKMGNIIAFKKGRSSEKIYGGRTYGRSRTYCYGHNGAGTS
jgi:putative aminopeptidase FrvX